MTCFILTSAQNNTPVNKAVWKNLVAYAKHRGARLMVGSYTYNIPAAQDGEKRKTSRERTHEPEWWAAEVLPYLADAREPLAKNLVWCGELQVLPTAVDPTSGLESYTARDSCIIPHPKFRVASVASPKNRGTKFVYTTGVVTNRNYIQKKAGQKAEFHHGFGAVIVEVAEDGSWFVRQLAASDDGTFYDLTTKVCRGRVTTGHRPEALVWGDIHTRQLEPAMRELGWGKGGILDTLRPRRQVLHDTLDFRSRNHHDRKDPWKMFRKRVEDTDCVEAEIAEAAHFVAEASRPWCETIVVASNHDRALERWLRDTDLRDDPVNASFYLEANTAAYQAIRVENRRFYVVEWAFRTLCLFLWPVTFLHQDDEYIICPSANGGIELGMHGDKGVNGAKGSLRGFAKMGRKCVVADSHTAGWYEGAVQVGVMGALDQEYNEGPSSWSHTNALVYPNGKRALFTIWRGQWHA